MEALVLDEVCKTFDGTRAVDGLSARIPAGTIYGFLGPNGAGKTTALRMVMNILRPDSGRIWILGKASGNRANGGVGYMPEERGLYPKMTVRAVLAYMGAIKGMTRHAAADAIVEWLGKVGLSDCADKRVEELSRGMQQKIQFVVTAIDNPELIILDEPFQGLDPINLDLIKDLMLEMRAAGKTVLLCTHMMDQAERLCDSFLLINRGRKTLDGALDEIQAAYATNAVLLEAEGDLSFLDASPLVREISRSGKSLKIVLNEGADAQDLLRTVLSQARVHRFEIKAPSLHEIFVRQVSQTEGSEP